MRSSISSAVHVEPGCFARYLGHYVREGTWPLETAVQRLAEMRHFSPEVAQRVARILNQQLQTIGDTQKRSYSGYKAVADLAKASRPVSVSNPATAIRVRRASSQPCGTVKGRRALRG